MKSYVLTLSNIHFKKQGKVWTSDPIDLYDNSSYTNYSTIDIGSTTDVEASVDFVGNQVQLNILTSTSGWTVKAMVTLL